MKSKINCNIYVEFGVLCGSYPFSSWTSFSIRDRKQRQFSESNKFEHWLTLRMIYLRHKEYRIMVKRYFAFAIIDHWQARTTMPWIRSLWIVSSCSVCLMWSKPPMCKFVGTFSNWDRKGKLNLSGVLNLTRWNFRFHGIIENKNPFFRLVSDLRAPIDSRDAL